MARNISFRTLLKQLFVFVFVFTGVVFWGHYFYSQSGGEVSTLLLNHAWDRALRNDKPVKHHFDMRADQSDKMQVQNQSRDAVPEKRSKIPAEQLRAAVSSLVSSEQNSTFLNNIAAGSIISITNADGKTAWFRIVRKKTSGNIDDCADLDAPKKDTTLVKCMSFRTASMPSQEYVLEPIRGTFVSGSPERRKAIKQDNNRL